MKYKREIIIYHYYSPVGEMILGDCEGQLCLCDWAESKCCSLVEKRVSRILEAIYKNGITDLIVKVVGQLDEYFQKKRFTFELPLLLCGTDFQKKVWMAVSQVKYGEIVSYRDLAVKVGCVGAVRAVAHAVASNALPVIVPCHRIIGVDYKLRGFSGGLALKQLLLDLESSYLF